MEQCLLLCIVLCIVLNISVSKLPMQSTIVAHLLICTPCMHFASVHSWRPQECLCHLELAVLQQSKLKALVEKLSKSKLSNKRTCHHFFVLKCHYLCSNALLKAVRERSKVKLKGYCACAYLHPRAGQQQNGVTNRCFRVACEFQLQR